MVWLPMAIRALSLTFVTGCRASPQLRHWPFKHYTPCGTHQSGARLLTYVYLLGHMCWISKLYWLLSWIGHETHSLIGPKENARLVLTVSVFFRLS